MSEIIWNTLAWIGVGSIILMMISFTLLLFIKPNDYDLDKDIITESDLFEKYHKI